MITQSLKLNLIPGQVLPRINVSQYDNGTRTLQMALYNGEQVFNIASGMSGFVQGTKPDRTGFQYAANVTVGSNIVTLDVTQQMAAVSGEVICELVIANGDDRIATVNFVIYVEPAALADDTIISETQLPLIEEAAELAQEIEGYMAEIDADADRAESYAVGTIDGEPVDPSDPTYHNNSKYYAEEAAATVQTVEGLAEDAEAWAVGKRGGVPVTSGDETYENNSKYYANEASDSATSASNSAGSASDSAEDSEAYAIGKRNGTDVTSGDPAYHNNSKYYAGEADTSAGNASTSETNAGLSASAAAQSEEDAEAWAVGERGGVPVTSGDPTYHNNAKYWNDQASGAVTDMVGATASTAGVHGLVPAPAAGDQDKVLHGDGTWGNVSTVASLSDLTDTTITSPADGQILQYDGANSKWKNTNGLANEAATRAQLGAHNLLPITTVSQTVNDVAFTVGTDGKITANGTATGGSASLRIFEGKPSKVFPSAGDYIFTVGNTNWVSNSEVFFGIRIGSTWTAVNYHITNNNAVAFTITSEMLVDNAVLRVDFNFSENVTTSGSTISPMIRLATDANTDYQPYALTNQQLTPYAQSQSNPNLLDNPWFTVNQRGFTSKTFNDSEKRLMSVDRWQIAVGTADSQVIQKTSNGMVLTASASQDDYLLQKAESELRDAIDGKTVTASLLFSDGQIRTGTIVVNKSVQQNFIDDSDIAVYRNSGEFFVIRHKKSANSVTIKAAKLELGSVSTLAMDTAPNYATELLKCQRYFQRLCTKMYGTPRWSCFGTGVIFTTTNASISVPIPCELRAVPSLTFNSGGGDFKILEGSSTQVNVTNISFDTISNCQVTINCATAEQTSISVNTAVRLWTDNADAYIDLSADL